MLDLFDKFIDNLFLLTDAMAIYILIGLFIAGVLKQLIPDDFVSKNLGKDSTGSVIKATLFGIPLPVCSCSVIPLAQGLRKEGASKGSVQSFLISTPITGVDSILATFSFFGLFFTVFRIISSIIIAITVGLIQNFVEKRTNVAKPQFSMNSFSVNKSEKSSEESSCCSSNSCCDSKEKKKFSLKDVFSYAYVTLFSDMARALSIGLLIGTLFTAFMPKEYSALLFENQFLTYFAIVLLAVPLYTCATASLPIAAAFMLQGMSAGAAFIFLTAGPATSAVTMSIVYKMLGKTSLIIYVSIISIMSLLFGYFFDTVFGSLEILNLAKHYEEASIINRVFSYILLFLLTFYLLKPLFNKPKSCCTS